MASPLLLELDTTGRSATSSSRIAGNSSRQSVQTSLETRIDLRSAVENGIGLRGLKMQRRQLAGFTLIELMVTILVAVVLISLAVPSFQDLVDKSRLRGATDDIVNLLNTSRASAVKLGLDVNASVTITSATTWCAGAISAVDPQTVTVGNPAGTAAACDCTSTTACVLSGLGTVAGQTSRVSSDSYSGVQLASHTTGNTILVANNGLVFNSKFGALDLSALSGLDYLTVTSRTGKYATRITVAALGQTYVCTSKGFVSGYPSC